MIISDDIIHTHFRTRISTATLPLRRWYIIVAAVGILLYAHIQREVIDFYGFERMLFVY